METRDRFQSRGQNISPLFNNIIGEYYLLVWSDSVKPIFRLLDAGWTTARDYGKREVLVKAAAELQALWRNGIGIWVSIAKGIKSPISWQLFLVLRIGRFKNLWMESRIYTPEITKGVSVQYTVQWWSRVNTRLILVDYEIENKCNIVIHLLTLAKTDFGPVQQWNSYESKYCL